jgi:hypothetical protein
LPLPRYVSRALSRGGYDQLGAFEPRLGFARDLWPSKEPRARQLLHDPPPPMVRTNLPLIAAISCPNAWASLGNFLPFRFVPLASFLERRKRVAASGPRRGHASSATSIWPILPHHEGNAMAIKINAQVTGYGPQPANTQALAGV